MGSPVAREGTETSCVGSGLGKVPADFQGIKATNTRYLALYWYLRFLRNQVSHSAYCKIQQTGLKWHLSGNRTDAGGLRRSCVFLSRAHGPPNFTALSRYTHTRFQPPLLLANRTALHRLSRVTARGRAEPATSPYVGVSPYRRPIWCTGAL